MSSKVTSPCWVDGIEVFICPPPDYPTDLANPRQTGYPEIWSVVIVENVIAVLFLAQRLYTKIWVQNKFQLEDATVIVAWLTSIVVQAIELHLYVVKATGVHVFEMPLARFQYFTKVLFCAVLVYQLTLGFSKATLCLFYRRLSPSAAFQTSVWVIFAMSTGSAVAIFLSVLLACKPMAASWDPVLASEAECINRPAIYLATAGIGIFTDLALLVLPIPTLLTLQMPTRQKLLVMALFAVGSLTLVTSIVRLVLLMPSLDSLDLPYALTQGTLWICIESNLLVICCCISTMRAFIRHLAPGLLGERTPKRSSEPHHRLQTIGGGDGSSRPAIRRSHAEKKMRAQSIKLGGGDDDDDDVCRPDGAYAATQVSSGDLASMIAGGRDDDSDKAILDGKTANARVKYESA